LEKLPETIQDLDQGQIYTFYEVRLKTREREKRKRRERERERERIIRFVKLVFF